MERSCPVCHGPIVEIHLAELTLRSCSACETRDWIRGDVSEDIEDVLRTFAEAPGGRRRRSTARAS